MQSAKPELRMSIFLVEKVDTNALAEHSFD
jgi:hypothetical protein